jgi:hypothetical protein
MFFINASSLLKGCGIYSPWQVYSFGQHESGKNILANGFVEGQTALLNQGSEMKYVLPDVRNSFVREEGSFKATYKPLPKFPVNFIINRKVPCRYVDNDGPSKSVKIAFLFRAVKEGMALRCIVRRRRFPLSFRYSRFQADS